VLFTQFVVPAAPQQHQRRHYATMERIALLAATAQVGAGHMSLVSPFPRNAVDKADPRWAGGKWFPYVPTCPKSEQKYPSDPAATGWNSQVPSGCVPNGTDGWGCNCANSTGTCNVGQSCLWCEDLPPPPPPPAPGRSATDALRGPLARSSSRLQVLARHDDRLQGAHRGRLQPEQGSLLPRLRLRQRSPRELDAAPLAPHVQPQLGAVLSGRLVQAQPVACAWALSGLGPMRHGRWRAEEGRGRGQVHRDRVRQARRLWEQGPSLRADRDPVESRRGRHYQVGYPQQPRWRLFLPPVQALRGADGGVHAAHAPRFRDDDAPAGVR
jgi:hypothetical protein